MFDHHDIYALDAAALHRLRSDVANLSDAELGLPTRCDGWTVEDLIQHMNAEHEAILNLFSDPLALARDVRTAFDTTAGRWIEAFAPDNNSPATVFVPKLAMEVPTQSVLSVHFMDMLVHRLDLADARGQSIHIPDEWISVALGVAQAISADSPLRDSTSPAYSYAAPVPVPADASALDALVAALGRNPVSGTTTSYLLVDMNNAQIPAQYSTGLSHNNIEQALIAAGKNLDHLEPADLALIEDFHTMGRIATSQLVDLIGITSDNRVLDAGSGIGGTARFVANQCRCHVTAVDLTEEYCETARWLNRLVGLNDRISVHQGDVTELPFADATFDVVFSQHVQMNIADKPRVYREARRVLASGGRLALWDITTGELGELDYPLPWADQAGVSHLATPDELRGVVESAGFAIDQWNDLTDQAASLMQTLLALPPSPLGLQAFVTDFAQKANNLTVALSDGRVRAIQGVARAIT